MMTVQLAHELRDTAITVNAADPGFTATNLNGHAGTQTVEKAVVVPPRLALSGAEGPNGAFLDAVRWVAWCGHWLSAGSGTKPDDSHSPTRSQCRRAHDKPGCCRAEVSLSRTEGHEYGDE